MENLLSSLSSEPERELNFIITEKTFSKDNGKFSAVAEFDNGNEFAIEARDEAAVILNNILDLHFRNYGLQDKVLKRISANVKEDFVETLQEGDFILQTDTVFPLVRTVLSSVRMLKELKSVENFQIMNTSSRFAVVARIETIMNLHFYNGCRTPRCFFKSVKDEMGTTVLDCPKCGERTEEPFLSTVFNVLIENGNAREQIALFTKEILQIAEEKTVESVENLVYMDNQELRNRFEKTFVFVVRPDIYGGAEWKTTSVFKID